MNSMVLFGDSADTADEKSGKFKDALTKFRDGVKSIWPGFKVNAAALDDLEAALLKSDVSLDTVEKLLGPLRDGSEVEAPGAFLRSRIIDIFNSAGKIKLDRSSSGPSVYFFVGVNGSGKTTSMAKLASELQGRTIFAAADTFRAAAIEQLQKWGDRLDVEVIAHQKGGDPTAVVYDALEAARQREADYLFVDTAGRLHTRDDLMGQLRKMFRVTAKKKQGEPVESLLVLDASTGQNGLQQVRSFAEELPVSGIVLSKLDSTARGGIALTVADELEVPVKLVGTGENLDDIAPFDPESYCDALLGEDIS